jgi:hypothetical protein
MPESLAPIGVQKTGDVAAAAKNREIRTRLQIIEAFQHLGIPYRDWPDFVRSFFESPQERARFTVSNTPPPFQPPAFDCLNQSREEWKKTADIAWKQFRDRFLEGCQALIALGVDEEIPPVRSTRGLGRKGRRLNAPSDLRFEWAARRLSGAAWKEIASDSFTESRIMKAAREVLKLAGWPTKVKAPKANALDAPLTVTVHVP